MRSKTFGIIVVICLLVSAQFWQAVASGKAEGAAEDFALQVYLPREVAIEDDSISLGQVCIVRGEESLVAKAGGIGLGRISVPGQEVIIDRPMVLSRLACSGIAVSKVRLTGAEKIKVKRQQQIINGSRFVVTGAEKIKVKRQQQIINGSRFVELASSFLTKNPPARSVCQLDPMRTPKDLVVLGAGKEIRLSPRLANNGTRSHAKVRVGVFADDKEIGVRDVTFRLKYDCRRAVSLVDIPAGMSISPANVKIEKTVSDYPEPANWNPPYGLVARRRIPANTMIRSYMAGSANPVVVVKRKQTVVIRIEMPGLLITAIGKAMQNGRGGEYIKVQNVDSQRIIFAKVNEDGTVEPVF
jgi:flagella basal body P-ring formation protein FlgA